MIFNNDKILTSFALGTHSIDANKVRFNYLFERREQLESLFGDPLSWRSMDNKKESFIECSTVFNGHNLES
ncbi:DUF4268 domain-containing protein [Allopusillimonas ginsengisoli]|nr:DUF4268 domain-containing protein [Allopusillimonas ginsengisoli]